MASGPQEENGQACHSSNDIESADAISGRETRAQSLERDLCSLRRQKYDTSSVTMSRFGT